MNGSHLHPNKLILARLAELGDRFQDSHYFIWRQILDRTVSSPSIGLSLNSVLEAISMQAGVFKEAKGLQCSRKISTLFPLICNGAEASISISFQNKPRFFFPWKELV